jgi:phosphohistidine phosphatase
MRTLYVLRHAKSSWDEPGLADYDRPLAPRGIDAAARIAEHMRREGVSPELVLCSPAARAKETLSGLGDALGDARVELVRALYEASESDLLAVLHGVEADVASVLLIGHNPSMQRLALLLSSGGALLDDLRNKYPTAGLATLEIPEVEWRHLRMGDATLAAFVKPRELPAP